MGFTAFTALVSRHAASESPVDFPSFFKQAQSPGLLGTISVNVAGIEVVPGIEKWGSQTQCLHIQTGCSRSSAPELGELALVVQLGYTISGPASWCVAPAGESAQPFAGMMRDVSRTSVWSHQHDLAC